MELRFLAADSGQEPEATPLGGSLKKARVKWWGLLDQKSRLVYKIRKEAQKQFPSGQTLELKEGDRVQLYGDYQHNALNHFVFCVTVL